MVPVLASENEKDNVPTCVLFADPIGLKGMALKAGPVVRWSGPE
jgi:hypothetical protein